MCPNRRAGRSGHASEETLNSMRDWPCRRDLSASAGLAPSAGLRGRTPRSALTRANRRAGSRRNAASRSASRSFLATARSMAIVVSGSKAPRTASSIRDQPSSSGSVGNNSCRTFSRSGERLLPCARSWCVACPRSRCRGERSHDTRRNGQPFPTTEGRPDATDGATRCTRGTACRRAPRLRTTIVPAILSCSDRFVPVGSEHDRVDEPEDERHPEERRGDRSSHGLHEAHATSVSTAHGDLAHHLADRRPARRCMHACEVREWQADHQRGPEPSGATAAGGLLR